MPRPKILTRRPVRPSLRVRLLATVVCLLATGAVIIVVAGVSAIRSHLTRQAGQQLRAYAEQLTSHPFQLTPYSQAAAPGAPDLAGLVPGSLAGLAAGTSAVSIEVRGSDGQLVMRTGPAGAGRAHAAAVQTLASRGQRLPRSGLSGTAATWPSPSRSATGRTVSLTPTAPRISPSTSPARPGPAPRAPSW